MTAGIVRSKQKQGRCGSKSARLLAWTAHSCVG
eukprot:CAMPEP_0173333496 /NCGR_PEP_ID=MMETSP1144-20121109/4915_1 /TAXON_ID=483371 /ORGANISM="non described non described, Strain CCMP2298" /LENGTH=32 /DNA_ID= /DNA_START= /DNA_END= /DNA_ORIENTATION=